MLSEHKVQPTLPVPPSLVVDQKPGSGGTKADDRLVLDPLDILVHLSRPHQRDVEAHLANSRLLGRTAMVEAVTPQRKHKKT